MRIGSEWSKHITAWKPEDPAGGRVAVCLCAQKHVSNLTVRKLGWIRKSPAICVLQETGSQEVNEHSGPEDQSRQRQKSRKSRKAR